MVILDLSSSLSTNQPHKSPPEFRKKTMQLDICWFSDCRGLSDHKISLAQGCSHKQVKLLKLQ